MFFGDLRFSKGELFPLFLSKRGLFEGAFPRCFGFLAAVALLLAAAFTPAYSQGTGQPALSGILTAHGPEVSGAYFADLQVTNRGTGDAQNIQISAFLFRTLSGTGIVRLDSSLSPALPLAIGDLAAGESRTVRLFLTVPPSILRFALTERGTLQDAAGTNLAFSIAQAVVVRRNNAPVVDAGPDQTITLPNGAALNGTVTDDNLPLGGTLTVEWSKDSGEGEVTFAAPSAAITTATFSEAGVYVLRLTASDSLLSSSDIVSITVNPANVPALLSVNPSAGQQGTADLEVVLTGQFTNFVQGTSAVSFGAGITVNTVTVADATHLTANLTIVPEATLGGRTVTVTTGAEVVSLVDAFTVQAGTPVLLSVNPNTGQQGAVDLQVALVGQFTNFVQGTSGVSFGAGITVDTVTVADATHLTASITIAPDATPGSRTVMVTTDAEVVSLVDGFTVEAGTPALLSVNPGTGQQGAVDLQVALTGQFTHFVQGTSGVSFGPGITVNTVTVTDATHLTASVTIAGDADLGGRTVMVTTGAEVVSLVDGFTVEAGTPALLSVNPGTGQQGATDLEVALTGQFTHFVQGTSAVSFGAGITVDTVTVADATHLTASITVAAGADLGGRTVTVTTGAEVVSLADGFTVLAIPAPIISNFDPKSAPAGTLVNVAGNNFVPTAGSVPSLTLNRLGGGTIDAPLSSFTNTALSFVIPTGAATGPLTIAVGGQSAVSADSLTITTSSSFTISAAPGSADLIQGQSATYAVTLASSNSFLQLATLGVAGVPSGVTAMFKPQQITAGQTALLTLSAPADQPVSTSTLTVSASASVEAIPLTQSADVTLNVRGITTSLIGRTVVDDPLQTPLAGVTVTMLGKNGNGGTTDCTGSTVSDEAGNFALTGLPSDCTGPQLVGYDGLTAISPPGDYAGVNLVYTLVSGQVTASPVLVHLPRIDDKETFFVSQNAPEDQSYSYQSIPGLSVTVYAGTTFTLPDGTQPDPFPLVAVQVPVDRLPDAKPPVPTMLSAFIVAFQPANAFASRPAAVFYPNTINSPPGDHMTMMTLDPTKGRMVPYGTATVSANGMQIVPDLDPAFPSARFGIVNFDWHGPMPPPPTPPGEPPVNPPPPPCKTCPCIEPPTAQSCNPVDFSSGLETVTETDISINGLRGDISIVRMYRTLSNNPGPFGIGTSHNYGHLLDQLAPQNALFVNVIMPEGTRLPFSRNATSEPFVNTTTPFLVGVRMTTFPDGSSDLRWKDGSVYHFAPSNAQIVPALESITDRNGNRVTLTRNPGQPAQITTVTDPVGRSLTLSYDGANRITSITDPIGRTVLYTYNAQGTLETVTDPEGGVTRYDYDPQNRLTKITDARGVVVAQNTYGPLGRLVQQVQADGGVLRFDYTFLNPTTVATPILATTVTDPMRKQTTYRFDPAGRLTDAQDSSGQVTSMVRSPAQSNQVTAYRGAAACPSCGDASAGDVSFKYDDRGNVSEKSDALGNTTVYSYEPAFHQVTSITDPLGNTTSFTYDENGNLLAATDPNGNTTSYKYDASGLLTESTDPLGNKTTFSYDAFGNLIRTTDALGNSTQFRYDGISRQIELRESAGRRLSTDYDRLDRVVNLIDAKGQATAFSYDAVGNLLSLSDAGGNTTTFTYDVMNRIKTRVDSRNKSEERTYDMNGNLISATDRRGQTSTFTYDELHRLTEEQYQDGNVVKRSYNMRGRLVQVDDSASGTFTFTYDLAGRLLQNTGPLGTVRYARDALGRAVRRQVVGQPRVDYSYDPAGNLLSTSMPQASVDITYDPRNLPSAMTRTNGVNTNYTYDPVGRLLSIVHTRSTTPLHALNYSYDGVGNRISQQTSSAQPLITHPAAATYDDANRIVQREGVTFTYDDNGNLIVESGPNGITTYTWDSRNRLESVFDSNGQSTTFTYDFGGNLIRRNDSGPIGNQVQSFILDDLRNVSYQSSSSGHTVSVLSGQSIDSHWVSITETGELEYALTDAINSTIVTVDHTGAIKGRISYEPFGETTATGSDFPFQFTGRPRVDGSLYYFRARYYDSVTSRFLSEDPILLDLDELAYEDFASQYAYASNAPTDEIDPLGLAPTGNPFRCWVGMNWCGVKCNQRCKGANGTYVGECTAWCSDVGRNVCLGLSPFVPPSLKPFVGSSRVYSANPWCRGNPCPPL